MAGYQVGIASETKAFKQGVESGIIEPLEDAQKELVELGKSKGPDQLEKGMKDAERATEKLGDETKRTAKAIEDDFRESYRKVKQSSDDGMDGAKEGLNDFKQEANQTAKESAASFDGSFESIVDMAQETAANAFGGFGPVGAAAGLAAAAGIGLAVKGFEDVNEASEESKARADEWADAYIEAGGRILTATQIVERGRSILKDQAEQLEKNAKNWGVSESVALLAMAGDANALLEAKNGLIDQEERLRDVNIRGAAATQESRDALKELEIAVRDGKSSYEELNDEMTMGSGKFDIYSDSLRLLAESTAEATKEVDEFGDTVYTLPDGKTIYIDAETGQATDDTNAIESKIYGIQDKRVSVSVDVSGLSEAQRAVNRFISQNDGKTIKVNGRFEVNNGSWD